MEAHASQYGRRSGENAFNGADDGFHGQGFLIAAVTCMEIPAPSKLTVMRSLPVISVISIIRLPISSIRWLHWFRSRAPRLGVKAVELKILNVGFMFDGVDSVGVAGMADASVRQHLDPTSATLDEDVR